MNVAVLGLGKVGLPLASYLRFLGHEVVGFDVDPKKTARLVAGYSDMPWEPGIETGGVFIPEIAVDVGAAVFSAEIVYVIVPTPVDRQITGCYLSSLHVEEVLQALTGVLPEEAIVVIGSTLEPEDAARLCVGRRVYNPPLIRLGHVMADLQSASVGLVGGYDAGVVEQVVEMWQWNDPTTVVRGDPFSIAMAKLAINATLSMRVAWANELDEVCRSSGASAETVLSAVRADPRIGSGYMQAGWIPGGPCLVSGTGVYTNRGIQPVEKVEVGDSVIGHDGKYHRVTKAYSREYAGRVVVIRPLYGSEAVLTPEHLALGVVRRKDRRERCANTHLVPHDKSWLQEPVWNPIAVFNRGDFLFRPNLCSDKSRNKILLQVWPQRSSQSSGEYVVLDEELAWLLGLYLAEGYPGTRGVFFALHEKEQDSIGNRLIRIAEKYFGVSGRVKHAKRGHGIKVEIYSKFLKQYLIQECAKGSRYKRMPFGFKTWSQSLRRALLCGLFEGDGSWSGDRFTWATVSRQLWEDVHFALLSEGILFGSRVSRSRTGSDGVVHDVAYWIRVGWGGSAKELARIFSGGHTNKKRHRRALKVSGGSGGWLVPVWRCFSREFEGLVYNLEVEEVESYLLESGFVVHNCLPRDLDVWDRRGKTGNIGIGTGIGHRVRMEHGYTKERFVDRVVADIEKKFIGQSWSNLPKVAVLGLVYNVGAMDATDSLGTHLMLRFLELGWEAVGYDPAGAVMYFPFPTVKTAREAVERSQVVVLTLPWPEFDRLPLVGIHTIDLRRAQ